MKEHRIGLNMKTKDPRGKILLRAAKQLHDNVMICKVRNKVYREY